MGQYEDLTEETPVWPAVLCIDDDPEISRALEVRLLAYRVKVLRAFHGMQGFWLAMTEKPDLIITDLQMPQGNGDYVVECLKNNSETSHIPVFVLTGKCNIEVEKHLRKLGVDEYFVKPCEFSAICKLIESYITLQPAEAEASASP